MTAEQRPEVLGEHAASQIPAAARRERKDDLGQRAGLRARLARQRQRRASGEKSSAINHLVLVVVVTFRRRTIEHQSLDDGCVAELLAHLVDRMLGLGGTRTL